MRRVAAALALLVLTAPAFAGLAAWSACAVPEPPRCCCRGDGDGCGCGCGAGEAPSRAPEPLAPLPQSAEQGLAAFPAVDEAPASDETQPSVAGQTRGVTTSATGLFLAICSFRC
jgi:hypothetical protein